MENETEKSDLPHGALILFQGDSITEAGRDRGRAEDLGTGYASMVASWFYKHFDGNVQCLNRGVGGDKVRDLKDRWRKDCLDLKPDVVSILVGINDTVGRCFWNKPTSTRSFEADYRSLLEQTCDVLGTKIVLLTPFMVNVTKLQFKYRVALRQKIGVVEELSREFGTFLIPLDRVFEEAARERKPRYLSKDGIHPTALGHSLIAQSWLKSAKGILAKRS